jgi:Tfp pilus assembly protein PilF
MRRLVLISGLIAGLTAFQAPAAEEGGAPPPAAGEPAAPDKAPPTPRTTVDELLDRLATATDEAEAKGIARLIERRWSHSGSDTADLLMSRAVQAMHAKDVPLAIEILDRVLVLQPAWAEAWYRRATAFFLLDDPVNALADLNQVVGHEPRHFGAWAGLGHIYMASKDKKRALEAYRRALALYPQDSDVRTLVERLEPEVDGRDI